MRYRKQITVPGKPADVFGYVADFSHAAEWDPGVVESRRLSHGPIAVGSRFELIARFRGNRQRFEYVVTEYDEHRRIALHGDGAKARSDDVITAESSGDGTRITYEADIRLKGIYALGTPLLGRVFRRMGDEALAGLKATLAGG